jgi:hypothetical protein
MNIEFIGILADQEEFFPFPLPIREPITFFVTGK